MKAARNSKATVNAAHEVPTIGSDSTGFYPQLWFLLLSLMVFATYVAWDLNLFSLILASDKSYMASLTMSLVVVMTLHCGWHIFHTSRHSRSAQRWLDEKTLLATQASQSVFVQRFVNDISVYPADDIDDKDAILEIHADAVRSPTELGWFFVDLAVRLGLLGTIIGFILIFASLDNIDIEGGDDLKNLLIAMSGGMGTALYTTLTGLVGASVLSFQYLILSRQSEHLVAQLLRIRRRLRHGVAQIHL